MLVFSTTFRATYLMTRADINRAGLRLVWLQHLEHTPLSTRWSASQTPVIQERATIAHCQCDNMRLQSHLMDRPHRIHRLLTREAPVIQIPHGRKLGKHFRSPMDRTPPHPTMPKLRQDMKLHQYIRRQAPWSLTRMDFPDRIRTYFRPTQQDLLDKPRIWTAVDLRLHNHPRRMLLGRSTSQALWSFSSNPNSVV
jgi:hypothetical protein